VIAASRVQQGIKAADEETEGNSEASSLWRREWGSNPDG
jgi:hypothetical protein